MLTSAVASLLGRRFAWRLGRSLYLQARGESSNGITDNGEALLIRTAINAWRARREGRPFVAFDIGGNLGEWSSVFVKEIGADPYRLEVFEPAPAAADHLERIIGCAPTATINRCAVSRQDGEAVMHLVAPSAGTNSLDARPAIGLEAVPISLVALQGFMDRGGIDRAHLVKMDTEGHDIEILRSITALLSQERIDVLQFEYNHRWLQNRGSLFEVFQLIEGTAYRLGRVTSTGVDLFDNWNPELDRFFEANYVLVRAGCVGQIGARSIAWDGSNVAI